MKENQHIEFKPGFNEDVIETLVAFANSKGGTVFVGVDDSGKPLKGFSIGKESLQNWVNEIKTKTQPQIIPDWEVIDNDGLQTLGFTVQEYPIKPVSIRGRSDRKIRYGYYPCTGHLSRLWCESAII